MSLTSTDVELDQRTRDELQPPCEAPDCLRPAEMLAWIECRRRGVHRNEGREPQYFVCGPCVEAAWDRVHRTRCGCEKIGTLIICTVRL